VCKDSRNTTIFRKIPENNYMFRPLIEWAIIRLKITKSHKITCNIHHVWGGRDLVFTMLLGVCSYDMDAFDSYGLGCCVFGGYDDKCVEGVFGRCLWAWEKEALAGPFVVVVMCPV
jgi:hypothetical protein